MNTIKIGNYRGSYFYNGSWHTAHGNSDNGNHGSFPSGWQWNQGKYYYQGGWHKMDSIEVWDHESKTWSLSSDLALSEAKGYFGAVSVPTGLVCP